MSPLIRSLALLALLPALASSAEPTATAPVATAPEQSSQQAQPTAPAQSSQPDPSSSAPAPSSAPSIAPSAAPPPATTKAAAAVAARQKRLTAAEDYAKEMKSCLEAWDSFTSMTKVEWRQTCQRTLKMRAYQPDIR